MVTYVRRFDHEEPNLNPTATTILAQNVTHTDLINLNPNSSAGHEDELQSF